LKLVVFIIAVCHASRAWRLCWHPLSQLYRVKLLSTSAGDEYFLCPGSRLAFGWVVHAFWCHPLQRFFLLWALLAVGAGNVSAPGAAARLFICMPALRLANGRATYSHYLICGNWCKSRNGNE